MAANSQLPPEYTESDRAVDEYGVLSDAPPDECDAAEYFCGDKFETVDGQIVFLPRYPIAQAKAPADYGSDSITQGHPERWKMTLPEPIDQSILERFPTIQLPQRNDITIDERGVIIETKHQCPCVCLLSNLPLIGGALPRGGNQGVYYEIYNIKMGSSLDYSIAIGRFDLIIQTCLI